MDKPDQRLFVVDLDSAEFRAGALKGYWGLAGAEVLPAQPEWPVRILWVQAAARAGAPARFFLYFDLEGYRIASPTGTFWDLNTREALVAEKRPKGKKDSRCAKVFRTDWEGGRAFYHPYDRVAAKGHPNWTTEQPSLIWDSNHTIVDYLEEAHSLLNSGEYLGI